MSSSSYSGRRPHSSGNRSSRSSPNSSHRSHESSPAKKARLGPEAFKWGNTTFMVPRRLAQEATQNKKHQYLSQTTRALRDHESASWTGKSACFSMRFNYQTTHRRAQLKLADLKGQTHTNCYQFLYINCARENFENIAIPNNGLIPNFQSGCAFIACRVTISPIQAWAGSNNPPDPIESRVL
jgi:hypothetical protein